VFVRTLLSIGCGLCIQNKVSIILRVVLCGCATWSLTQRQLFPKCRAHAQRGTRGFLGKLYSKIELIVIPKMSDIDCLISCIALIYTSLAATRSHRSVKSFLHLLHLLHGLKPNVTNSSCSLVTFGITVTGISSCSVCSPRLNSWHSLQLYVHTFVSCLFSLRPAVVLNITLLCWAGVKFSPTKCGRCTLNFLPLAVMDEFLSGYERTEIMKLV
jgi:hypothetical protein